MGQIVIKFDHKLDLPHIVVPLTTPKPGEDNEQQNPAIQIHQTAEDGVVAPLIQINSFVLKREDIIKMHLFHASGIPHLDLIINDTNNYFEGLQSLGSESEVRLQILPRFDNIYQKINLVFYITSVQQEGKILDLSCSYKIMDLYSNHIKSFGFTNTYNFFEQMANECKLGFASNVISSDDWRYVYAANHTYKELMDEVIGSSGSLTNNKIYYEYWIDWWNNINLVDSYERFNSTDPEDEMKICVPASRSYDTSSTSNDEKEYNIVPAVVTNFPNSRDSELYIDSYELNNSSSQLRNGSDRIISAYRMSTMDTLDILLSDGDQKQDICAKSTYLGENYQEYDYLCAEGYRSIMRNKIYDEKINIVLPSPSFGFPRGGKINVHWYDKNETLNQRKKALGIKSDQVKTNIKAPKNIGADNASSGYELNNQITGQYYILSTDLVYYESKWYNLLTLSRPRATKSNYIDSNMKIDKAKNNTTA